MDMSAVNKRGNADNIAFGIACVQMQ